MKKKIEVTPFLLISIPILLIIDTQLDRYGVISFIIMILVTAYSFFALWTLGMSHKIKPLKISFYVATSMLFFPFEENRWTIEPSLWSKLEIIFGIFMLAHLVSFLIRDLRS